MTAPVRRRSRQVRAAALISVGLGAAACDDAPPPPDVPGQTEARLAACRAAHDRLGADPARCDVLERVVAREHAETRPLFETVAACEASFGSGACEGGARPDGAAWRPLLMGWTGDNRPVIRDRQGQHWALAETGAGGAVPRRVEPPAAPPDARSSLAFDRVAPIYAEQQSCEADWGGCAGPSGVRPNRFLTRLECEASWSHCAPVTLNTAGTDTPGTGSGAPPSGGQGTSWSHSYDRYWVHLHLDGARPRYQGWTWTANREPVPAYRPPRGTGPLQAWDIHNRRLGAAVQMDRVVGWTSASARSGVTQPSTTVSRAGFGSTGRSYSAGG